MHCIDQQLVYYPFNNDFGPLDLGKVYEFVTQLDKMLIESPNSIILHYSSFEEYDLRANAAFLMCAYQVIIINFFFL